MASISYATFSGMSEPERREYTAKLLQAGYATDENKRMPEMRKLLEVEDVATQKSATYQQGQRTVWTGATHNSDFTYKVSENNLEKWDGK